ncbi:MAG: hypothetical protein LEGION0398_MBIBDBAK_00640 [Legionellaceae bacterium]
MLNNKSHNPIFEAETYNEKLDLEHEYFGFLFEKEKKELLTSFDIDKRTFSIRENVSEFIKRINNTNLKHSSYRDYINGLRDLIKIANAYRIYFNESQKIKQRKTIISLFSKNTNPINVPQETLINEYIQSYTPISKDLLNEESTPISKIFLNFITCVKEKANINPMRNVLPFQIDLNRLLVNSIKRGLDNTTEKEKCLFLSLNKIFIDNEASFTEKQCAIRNALFFYTQIKANKKFDSIFNMLQENVQENIDILSIYLLQPYPQREIDYEFEKDDSIYLYLSIIYELTDIIKQNDCSENLYQQFIINNFITLFKTKDFEDLNNKIEKLKNKTYFPELKLDNPHAEYEENTIYLFHENEILNFKYINRFHNIQTITLDENIFPYDYQEIINNISNLNDEQKNKICSAAYSYVKGKSQLIENIETLIINHYKESQYSQEMTLLTLSQLNTKQKPCSQIVSKSACFCLKLKELQKNVEEVKSELNDTLKNIDRLYLLQEKIKENSKITNIDVRIEIKDNINTITANLIHTKTYRFPQEILLKHLNEYVRLNLIEAIVDKNQGIIKRLFDKKQEFSYATIPSSILKEINNVFSTKLKSVFDKNDNLGDIVLLQATLNNYFTSYNIVKYPFTTLDVWLKELDNQIRKYFFCINNNFRPEIIEALEEKNINNIFEKTGKNQFTDSFFTSYYCCAIVSFEVNIKREKWNYPIIIGNPDNDKMDDNSLYLYLNKRLTLSDLTPHLITKLKHFFSDDDFSKVKSLDTHDDSYKTVIFTFEELNLITQKLNNLLLSSVNKSSFFNENSLEEADRQTAQVISKILEEKKAINYKIKIGNYISSDLIKLDNKYFDDFKIILYPLKTLKTYSIELYQPKITDNLKENSIYIYCENEKIKYIIKEKEIINSGIINSSLFEDVSDYRTLKTNVIQWQNLNLSQTESNSIEMHPIHEENNHNPNEEIYLVNTPWNDFSEDIIPLLQTHKKPSVNEFKKNIKKAITSINENLTLYHKKILFLDEGISADSYKANGALFINQIARQYEDQLAFNHPCLVELHQILKILLFLYKLFNQKETEKVSSLYNDLNKELYLSSALSSAHINLLTNEKIAGFYLSTKLFIKQWPNALQKNPTKFDKYLYELKELLFPWLNHCLEELKYPSKNKNNFSIIDEIYKGFFKKFETDYKNYSKNEFEQHHTEENNNAETNNETPPFKPLQ